MIVLYYIVWFLPLTGVLLGTFLLPNMLNLLTWGIRNPLDKKGIYDPIQKVKLILVLLFADLFWRINVSYWVSFLEEDDLLIYDCSAIMYGPILLFAGTSILCKYLLPNIIIRNVRKTSNSTNYSRWGVVLGIIFFIDAILALLIQFETCWYTDENEALMFSFLSIGLGFVYSLVPYKTLKRYDRIKNEAERTISSIVTQRAPIIFLRSFEIDKCISRGYSFDEYICKSFSITSQPILSLSDPDDFLPTGGSIKIQSFDEKWKDAIITLFKNCRAVVIFEGKSEGLKWEIENLKRYITHDKLFVATPPKMYRESTWCRGAVAKERKYVLGYIWKNFSNHLNKEGFYLPSSDPGSDVVFAFEKNWEVVNAGEVCKGMKLFDYILKKTVKYENAICNYKELAETLSSYELSLTIPKDDQKRINRALLFIAGIIACIIICITIIF